MPLESALKTFVFFLISQPLIYLLQVPFSILGWQILHFYLNWIVWTLLTFPMAFVGWFITKKNWLSVLIFAPVFAYLGYMSYGYVRMCAQDFPRGLIAALFCLLQIVLYIIAFFPDVKQKLVGIGVPVITAIILAIVSGGGSRVEMGLSQALPGGPSFSEEAVITIDDESVASIKYWSPEDGSIFIHTQTYGTATITVTDGGETYQYILEVYREDGNAQLRITPVGPDGTGRS